MKFKSGELQEICKTLKSFVATADIFPILKNICFDGKYIQAFNSVSACIIPFETENSFLVPFNRFHIFIDSLPKDNDITYSIEKNIIKLSCGKSRASIPVDTGIEAFPSFAEFYDYDFEECGEEFYTALKTCQPFSAKNVANYALTGVNFADNYLMATNGERIAIYTLDKDYGKSAIIPSEFIKLLSGIDSFLIQDGKFFATKDDYLMITNVIDSEYPEVLKYIPEVSDEELMELPSESLSDALVQVGKFSEEDKDDTLCTLEFGDNGITISYGGKKANISKFFDFGNTIGKRKFLISPFMFSEMLKYCDLFAVKDKILYGIRGDFFEALISIRNE